MRLQRNTGGELCFGSPNQLGAAALIGGAFLFVGLMPLVGPGAVTLERVATALVCFAIGSALVFFGWTPPLHRSSVVRVTAEGILLAGSKLRSSDVEVIRLSGSHPTDSGTPCYQVEVVLKGGRAAKIIEAPNPAAALRDMAPLVELLRVPVVRGWGLPATSEAWLGQLPAREPRVSGRVLAHVASEAQRRDVVVVVVGIGAVVALLMAREIWVRISKGDSPTVLDLALPIAMVASVLLVAAIINSRGVRVLAASDRLIIEQRSFGFSWERYAIPRHAIRAVHLVSPAGAFPRHLLLETDYGPFAILETKESERVRAYLSEPSA